MVKTYQFYVALPEFGNVWRKIELRADQSLHDLHLAIQGSFSWDADHLYSFFMSGEAWDSASEYTLLQNRSEMPFGLSIEEGEEEEDENEVPEIGLGDLSPEDMEEALTELADIFDTTPDAIRGALEHFMAGDEETETAGDAVTTTIESLDLDEGDEFLYLFDYGDEWHFYVRCDAVYDQADPDLFYPRLIAAEGADPPQYVDWDEEEDEYEEEEEDYDEE
jgi:hypothetical protein